MPRPRTHPVINTRLATVIDQTGLPLAAIAEQINIVYGESGYQSRRRPGSLNHWLRGAIPDPDTITATAEAFSRLLPGQTISAADLGWPDPGRTATAPDPWSGDPVTWLTKLGRDDMIDSVYRRAVLNAGFFSLAAAVVPTAPQPIPRRPSERRGGRADIDHISEMTDLFSAADDSRGGHARTAVIAYLTTEVTPLLHGTTGRTRPALFTAAAQLTYLVAFMSADAGRAGTAQNYYIQAHRLAAEAADRHTQATVLRAMALQATELGHPTTAVALADAAAAALPVGAPPQSRAWMLAMQAEAHAAHGAPRQALAYLRDSERELQRADSPASATQPFGRAALEHQTGQALARLGDLPTAETHLAASQHHRPPTQRRSRALIGARLARTQIAQGRPDQAATTLIALRHDLAAVASARLNNELTAVRTDWRPHHANTTVAQADHILAQLLRHVRR